MDDKPFAVGESKERYNVRVRILPLDSEEGQHLHSIGGEKMNIGGYLYVIYMRDEGNRKVLLAISAKVKEAAIGWINEFGDEKSDATLEFKLEKPSP